MDSLTAAAPPNRVHRPADLENHPRSLSTDKPFFGDNGFGFDDILDVLNPLQHIPVLNTIYRRLTGDEISMGSRLAGGALYGGAIGFAASLANAVIEDTTGRDVGGHVLALFWPEQSAPAEQPNGFVAAPQAVPTPAANAPAPLTFADPEHTPAFLAALPSREDALAAREDLAAREVLAQAHAAPHRAASGDVPILSPAAMGALLLSLNLTGANDDEEEDEAHESLTGLVQTPLQDPVTFAAWQAVAARWQGAHH